MPHCKRYSTDRTSETPCCGVPYQRRLPTAAGAASADQKHSCPSSEQRRETLAACREPRETLRWEDTPPEPGLLPRNSWPRKEARNRRDAGETETHGPRRRRWKVS